MLETHSFSNPILQRKSVIQNKCQLGNTNLKIKKNKKKKKWISNQITIQVIKSR